MLTVIPNFTPPYADLAKLASTSFAPNAFREQCETFAKYSKSDSFEDLWYFRLPASLPTLVVSVDVDYQRETGSDRQTRVRFAVLPFVGWEDFRSDSQAPMRQQFDNVYEESVAEASASLGPPDAKTTYSTYNFHRSVWNGSTGIMLLQQSNYDPQFGAELHCWIQSHEEQESPFRVKQDA